MKELRDMNKKLSALDPRFRKKIENLFNSMSESISMLYEAATRDEKTGLYNNKFFETILEMEVGKAARRKQNLSLFIVDIDFFKQINDKYGHIRADELLARLAKIIQKHIRKSDIAARFGGEEFFILFPGADLKKAKKITSRLRSAIRSDKLLKKHNLTVSGGLSQYRRTKDTKKALKKRVDKALYMAKHSGRDKFVSVE